MARKTGRQVMIWGDMPLHYPQLRRQLPKDIIIGDWHYGPEGSRQTLELYKSEGFRTLACPSIGAHTSFGVDVDGSTRNITKMVGDAVDLNLEGFLLTTWEFGFGSSYPETIPWVAMAGAVARGEKIHQPSFIADFAHNRYGIDGNAFYRLTLLLSDELKKILDTPGAQKMHMTRLRKSLFRAADPLLDLSHPQKAPPNNHQQIWEPSPFHTWLNLRAILNDQKLKQLRSLAKEAESLADAIFNRAFQRHDELIPLVCLASALGVVSRRLDTLEKAKSAYHRAALAQGRKPDGFKQHLAKVTRGLQSLEPGLKTLKTIVEKLDDLVGFDPAEHRWIEVHERGLKEHIAALKKLRSDGDSLLEFGEFLRRPAHITARVTWR
jgi:hypothetical protein